MIAGSTAAGLQAGLIVREREPVNLESPFDQLDQLLTPNHLFYVRSHFKAPLLDSASHRLEIGGAVDRPFSISLDELRSMPAVTRTATLECAGNSRVLLVPQVEGAQWELGAVGTAEWTGVPLSALLDRAGLKPAACEIVLAGADQGKPKEKPQPPGETHYSRSFALTKASDVLIAYAMNGEVLGVDHGYPLRAIVPGHYGMASVKWLSSIHAVTTPFQGYFQTSDYAFWDEVAGNPVRRPLGPMALKSAIARPRIRELIPRGSTYKVLGAAWGSQTHVTAVEFSCDDGESWQIARLLDPPQPFVWRRWEYEWHVPATAGRYVLKSRATDAEGNVQPGEHDSRYGSYVVHHTFPIEVDVR